MTWFLDSLRLDFEVLSRSLANTRAAAAAGTAEAGQRAERAQ